MRMKSLTILLIGLLTLGGYVTAVAQDEPANEGVAIIVNITPKPGQSRALEEAITNYHHWVGEHGGALRFMWFEVMTGPDTGSYIARSGEHDWADFDFAGEARQAAMEKFASEVAPHIEDSDVAFTVEERDWGIWPESMDGYTLFSISDWHVRTGRVGAFRASMSRIDAILKEHGFPNYYGFARVVSGGSGYQITLVSPRRNFADMSPKDPSFIEIMQEALGGADEANNFLQAWGETYQSGESFLLRLRPELSQYGD